MFVGDGKKQEVIIRVMSRTSTTTGMFGSTESTLDYDRLDVWADAGHLENIKKVPGVMEARVAGVSVNYWVFLDPRYDTQWVIEEIKARLQIELPKKTRKKRVEYVELDEGE